MGVDEYLQSILYRETVATGPLSPVRDVQAALYPTISEWANRFLLGVHPSGSFMRGTANKRGTDIDLFISVSELAVESLQQIYQALFTRLRDKGYAPTQQNVSINVRVNGYSVDLVPGQRQCSYGDDHSLYRRKRDTWIKTNVATHIRHVVLAGRQRESRIIKLWRDQKRLDFPSFYLELAVIDALPSQVQETLSGNVWRVFEYLKNRVQIARIIDPANTNNIVSDDLSIADKNKISTAAASALGASDWNEIVT